MTNPGNVKLYTNGSSAMLVEESVSGQIADIIEKEKLKGYNIENLSQILDEVKTIKEVTLYIFNDQYSFRYFFCFFGVKNIFFKS